MSRNKGISTYASNFEVLKDAPLDSRSLVDAYADLTKETTWQNGTDSNKYVYVGMLVVCKDKPGQIYQLIAEDYTQESNWKQISGGNDASEDGDLVTKTKVTFNEAILSTDDHTDNSTVTTDSKGCVLVDLGLPSGLLWTKYTLGANSQGESGLYYLFGSTTGYNETDILSHVSYESSPCNGGNSTYNETAVKAWVESNTTNGVLNDDVDAAYKYSGGLLHIPTKEQWEELIANTTQTAVENSSKTTYDGGIMFTSKTNTDAQIFISNCSIATVSEDGTAGFAWRIPFSNTSTLGTIEDSEEIAAYIAYSMDPPTLEINPVVSIGATPVMGVASNNIETLTSRENDGYVDLGLPSGTLWAKGNIGASKDTDKGLFFQWGDPVGAETPKDLTTSVTTPWALEGDPIATVSAWESWIGDNTLKNKLKSNVDAAYYHTKGEQCMPTYAQLLELCNFTTQQPYTIDGVKGVRFCSLTDSSKYIFLPYITDNDAMGRNSTDSDSATSMGIYVNSKEVSQAIKTGTEDSWDDTFIIYSLIAADTVQMVGTDMSVYTSLFNLPVRGVKRVIPTIILPTESGTLALWNEVQDMVNNHSFDSSSYYTKTESDDKYAVKSELPTKMSQLINDKGFLTEHQSLEGYAKTSDIPTNVSAFTNDAGYLTSHQDISGKLNTSGGTMTGDLIFSDCGGTAGTGTRQIRMQCAGNDYGRIAVGGTASNAGFMEIATADDANEPIYIRQYTGTYTTVKRTATLLDANGNTSFPGTVTAPTFTGSLSGNATSATSASVITKNSSFNDASTGRLSYYDADISNTSNNANWSAPSKGWHQIIHNDLSVGGYWTELAFPVNDVNGLAWRQRRSTSYFGWYRILDSNNYNSYVPSKTGSGASGTWGINISGSAAKVAGYAVSVVSSLPSSPDSNTLYFVTG